MKKKRKSYESKTCAKCGGQHFGERSGFCPIEEAHGRTGNTSNSSVSSDAVSGTSTIAPSAASEVE